MYIYCGMLWPAEVLVSDWKHSCLHIILCKYTLPEKGAGVCVLRQLFGDCMLLLMTDSFFYFGVGYNVTQLGMSDFCLKLFHFWFKSMFVDLCVGMRGCVCVQLLSWLHGQLAVKHTKCLSVRQKLWLACFVIRSEACGVNLSEFSHLVVVWE